MPPDDQSTRSAMRCTTHPGNPSVAVCHSCGRPLCLTCAVPVRGEVFGPECLGEVLGPDTLPPRAVAPRPRNVLVDVAGAGFLGTIVASILPWTRFSVSSGWFGAWGIVRLRWSSLAAFAALAGVIVWFLLRRSGRPATRLRLASLVALAAASLAGSILHVLNPPPFTHAWLGPWVAIGTAAVALVASGWALVRGPIRAGTSVP